MLMRRLQFLLASVLLAAALAVAVEQAAVAEAVKWLHLPALTSDGELSARVADMMVESHRARYRIAMEALDQPKGSRTDFLAQNSQRLTGKVRSHLGKLLLAQPQDAKAADSLAASVHSGIRTAQNEIYKTPIRKLVYPPLPARLTSWKLRVSDAWRQWNGVSALRHWRAVRLLRQDNTPSLLQTQLEADMERYMARLRSQIAESHSTPVHDEQTFPVEPSKPARTTYFKHILGKMHRLSSW